MPHGGTKIKRVRLYECGYCTQNAGMVFQRGRAPGGPAGPMKFPANAALIEHADHGRILFDTGYSMRIFGKGLFFFLYRLLLRPVLRPEEPIHLQLRADGIPPESIRHIVLSHVHPDHVGGIRAFRNFRLIATPELLQAVGSDRLCGPLLPDPSSYRPHLPRAAPAHWLARYFTGVFDVFGDESLYAVELDGHSRQIGLFLPECSLFFIGDAVWRAAQLTGDLPLRFAAGLIQKNRRQYDRTLRRLQKLKREHTQITFIISHEQYEDRDLWKS